MLLCTTTIREPHGLRHVVNLRCPSVVVSIFAFMTPSKILSCHSEQHLSLIIAIRERKTKTDAKSGDRYHIFNEAVSRLVTELWKMCTSPRFSLIGSRFSFVVQRYQQDQINCENYTRDNVNRSIGSGFAGLGFLVGKSNFPPWRSGFRTPTPCSQHNNWYASSTDSSPIYVSAERAEIPEAERHGGTFPTKSDI